MNEKLKDIVGRMDNLVKTKLRYRTGETEVIENFEGLIREYDNLTQEQDAKENKALKANLLFNLASAYEHAGNLEKAIETNKQVVEINPKDHEAMYNAATNLCKLGRFNEALPLLEKVVELKPENASYQQNLAYARRRGPEVVTRSRGARPIPMKHPRLGWGPIC